MSNAQLTLVAPAGLSAGLQRLVDELVTLAWALCSPRSVIAEVETWRALIEEADAVAAHDPQRAQRLRREAARIGRA